MKRARAPIHAALGMIIAASPGCSLESGGSADFESLADPGRDRGPLHTTREDAGLVPDTGSPDSAASDEGTDTGAGDTSASDTASADTGVIDTGTADTGTPDTGSADTGVSDTGSTDTGSDTGTTGLLTGTGMQPSYSIFPVNLTAEGTLDWAHWGRGSATAFDHKATGGTAITSGTPSAAPNWYGGYSESFSWSDGTPLTTMPATSTGIFFDTAGKNIVFTSAADNASTRTLKVYLAWNAGSTSTMGTITAHLSDSSAADWMGNIPPPGAAGGGNVPAIYTFTYRTASKPATVNITVKQTGGTFLSLLSATLK